MTDNEIIGDSQDHNDCQLCQYCHTKLLERGKKEEREEFIKIIDKEIDILKTKVLVDNHIHSMMLLTLVEQRLKKELMKE